MTSKDNDNILLNFIKAYKKLFAMKVDNLISEKEIIYITKQMNNLIKTKEVRDTNVIVRPSHIQGIGAYHLSGKSIYQADTIAPPPVSSSDTPINTGKADDITEVITLPKP